VVADYVALKPEDIAHTERLAHHRLKFLTAHAWIADLSVRVKVALLRRQQRTVAIHIDATAFKNKRASLPLSIKQTLAQPPRGDLRYATVIAPIRILGPRIEME